MQLGHVKIAYFNGILFCCTSVLAAVLFHQTRSESKELPAADHSLPVVGFVGKSVKLPCNIESPDVRGDETVVIEWIDLVYNTDHNPNLLFTTANGRGLDQSHKNAVNFRVDTTDFSLTISDLKLALDAGQYICRRIVKGTTFERSYYLNVAGQLNKQIVNYCAFVRITGVIPFCSASRNITKG
jgi:Immunoglobulin V-set domain